MSASDPEPRANARLLGTQSAAARLASAIAIAAALLIAALGAAPARADDTGGTATVIDSPTPNDGGTGAIDPPPNPIGTSAPDSGGGTAPDSGGGTPAQDPPAGSDPNPPATVDTGTPSTTSPSSSADDPTADDKAAKRAPAHDGSSDSTAPSSSSGATSTPTGTPPGAQPLTATTTLPPDSSGYPGDWTGQDSFLVATAPVAGSGGSGPGAYGGRFPGLFAFAATRATRIEARQRRGHETAKVSPLGGGLPGGGGGLPHDNPFFNLLSGPGGAGGSLMLISLLAVLGASIALPRALAKPFRTPSAPWRPLAYVPPIELPG